MSMADTANRSCPTCRGEAAVTLAVMTAGQVVQSSPYYDAAAYQYLGVGPESTFPIVRCESCGLVYAGHLPSTAFLERLYNAAGGKPSDRTAAVFARPGRMAQQLRQFSFLLDALDEAIPKDEAGVPTRPIRVLDYGCSFGAGLLSLHRSGFPYTVTGIEVDASARAYLAEQSVDVFESLNDLDPCRQFDAIVLNDVLEHLVDPLGVLCRLNALAEQDAFLLVNVPDFSQWRLRYVLDQIRSGRRVEKDMNPWEHLVYFSPETLTAMTAAAGWKRSVPATYAYALSRPGGAIGRIRGAARLVRDWYRFQRGTWPGNYSTSGLFVKND